jgi:alpha-beta hydrolase superfamily lysophospholipase
MKFNIHVGTHKLHKDSNINYQLNRQITLGSGKLEQMREVASRIKDLADWKREFLLIAEKAESEGRILEASSYYRGAEFFMTPGDPDKPIAYDKSVELFNEFYKEDFGSGTVKVHEVPYENGLMPAWHLPAKDPANSKGVIVLHGGFDSTIEEIYPSTYMLWEAGYEVVSFDGPGQGAAIRKHHLVFTHEWEKPVKEILDYFEFKDVTLIGVSLGGYLAPRAAAFEPRIKRVVAWGVMFDFFEVLTSARGKMIKAGIKTMMALRGAPVLNAVTHRVMKKDPFSKWGVEHGMYVFGVNSPYDYFKKAKAFSMKNISHLITQDFLLLAGTEDHFVRLDQFYEQARRLTNVRSFTGRIFTRHESAENHCQLGNLPLVFNVILDWIEERSRDSV